VLKGRTLARLWDSEAPQQKHDARSQSLPHCPRRKPKCN
jgi:hypothetical protein